MNWCKPHWDKLRAAIKEKGLENMVATNGKDAIERFANDKYEPLLDSWGRINNAVLHSPALNGRILVCPCCILEMDGQPELVDKWIDGATTDSMNYAISKGYVKFQ